MVFSSLVFLCVFFPLQMLIYAFAKSIEAKNTVLIIFSVVFYAWGEPFFVLMLLFMAFADWAVSQFIYKYRGTGKSKAFLVLGCIIDLGLLAFFKYNLLPAGRDPQLVRLAGDCAPDRPAHRHLLLHLPAAVLHGGRVPPGGACPAQIPAAAFVRLSVPSVHRRAHRPLPGRERADPLPPRGQRGHAQRH